MNINYANKLVGVKKRLDNLLKELSDDSKEFDYSDFYSRVGDLEDSFFRITDSLRESALDKFRKILYRR